VSDTKLTVLFATKNGEHVLPRTLEAYCRVVAPQHGWKIVIVDNGSYDSTPVIVASFQKRLPLEILLEPTAGKNRALNRGLGALEGQLAIITDDDAIPDPSFLIAWSRYLSNCQDYQLFGGSIDPLFELPPPKWLSQSKSQMDMLFAVRSLGEGPIAPNEIYGPNMAVRASVFAGGFRFDENIGPNGSDPYYPMGSETEFCCRIVKSGAKAWFAQAPRVAHIVRSSQLSKSYWAMRSYRHGRGIAKLSQMGQYVPPDMSRPKMVDQLSLLRCWAQMFSPFPSQRFNAICDYHWRQGYRDEYAKTRMLTRRGTSDLPR
jgi:glycosyltransferase involved in cell wall biosynthesis